MEDSLKDLEPEAFWRHFINISRIPRCSGEEEKVREYVALQAANLGLTHRRDAAGNLVVAKPGMITAKSAPTVVLQSHLDMVCEKEPGLDFDFKKDPLRITRNGNWIQASGTTLGADNGVGVAMSLALMEAKEYLHGPLEFLFTVGEEVGLTGVQSISKDIISGRVLVNLDCEDINTFYVGSAGSLNTYLKLSPQWKEVPPETRRFRVVVEGLKGGHSGLDIHRGRANAVKVLARLILAIQKGLGESFCLGDISGGSSLNAIPRRAEATVMVSKRSIPEFKETISEFSNVLESEYRHLEPDLKLIITELNEPQKEKVFSREFEDRLILLLMALPQGVFSWDPQQPGLVRTSTNLGAARLDGEGRYIIGTKQRSFLDSEMYALSDVVKACGALAKASAETGGNYPGWEPRADSPLLKRAKEVYCRVFEREPVIASIHAGLECGVLSRKFDDIDAISFGATIRNAHSPGESLEISSVQYLWSFLTALLQDLAQQI
ncbi:MAG: beta-Ala-His dipeptidase [Deltaproteobacteria bacterium]|nr:beta-Ala-His dipeptidase [Deltaproteobacteria bacterium]MBW2138010.1 beta-Ala-His dipeptidase [Deltaproteobacteria bacterium]